MQQLAVVVGAELAQERLGQDVGAGIGPIAHALGDRGDVRGARLLDEVGELVLRELRALGQGDAELLQEVLVVVEFVGIGFLRQRPGLAVVRPRLARPVVDLAPVDQVVERDDVTLRDVLRLVGLDVEHVRALAGRQCRLERGVKAALLVPGDLDVQARMRRLEIARCLLAERHFGRLVGLVAPDGERGVLGPGRPRAGRDENRPCQQRHAGECPRPSRSHGRFRLPGAASARSPQDGRRPRSPEASRILPAAPVRQGWSKSGRRTFSRALPFVDHAQRATRARGDTALG